MSRSRFALFMVALFGASIMLVSCDLGTDPLPDQACYSDAECPADLHCLVNQGVCVQCLQDDHCAISNQCDEVKHTCDAPDPDCTSDGECAVNGICVVGVCDAGKCTTEFAGPGTACSDGNQCTENDQCVSGQCTGAAIAGCGVTGCEGMKDGTECDDGDDCTASDTCQNGVCEGLGVPGCGFPEDLDQDGYSEMDGDCNDSDPYINPAAMEICDKLDNNCNGEMDEDCVEPSCFVSGCNSEVCLDEAVDSDCEWRPEFECLQLTTCGPYAPGGGCGWDLNEAYLECLDSLCVGQEEICDGVDNDCNGQVDEGCGTECGGFGGFLCQDGEFCQYQPDTCFMADGFGTCVVIPQSCPEYYSPVCGCDGVTYGNECMMASNLVSLWHLGSCEEETCKAVANEDFGFCLAILGVAFDGEKCVMVSGCECGEFCPWVFPTPEKCEAACGLAVYDCEDDQDCPDGMICQVYCGNGWCNGTCQPGGGEDQDNDGWYVSDGDCDDTDPTTFPGAEEVCDQADNNCDGKVDEMGCGSETCGGFVGATCAPGSYCEYPVGTCGAADEMGNCKVLPGACPGVYMPVCGCDMKTYSNQCEAAASGQSVWKTGACQ